MNDTSRTKTARPAASRAVSKQAALAKGAPTNPPTKEGTKVEAPAQPGQPSAALTAKSRRRNILRLIAIAEWSALLILVIIKVGAINAGFYESDQKLYVNYIMIQLANSENLALLFFVLIEIFIAILNGKPIFALLYSIVMEEVHKEQGKKVKKKTSPKAESSEIEYQEEDVVETTFANYVDRSRSALESAQRRPNALLFVGTLVAAVGLAFFLATLPNWLTTVEAENARTDIYDRMLDLVPRIRCFYLFSYLLASS